MNNVIQYYKDPHLLIEIRAIRGLPYMIFFSIDHQTVDCKYETKNLREAKWYARQLKIALKRYKASK